MHRGRTQAHENAKAKWAPRGVQIPGLFDSKPRPAADAYFGSSQIFEAEGAEKKGSRRE
jgi:hypothetical protein